MLTRPIKTIQAAKPPLTRVDWLGAALKLFVSDGVDAVQITRLSKLLNVTRGSFYWHFKNRDDLLTAIINEWEAANEDLSKLIGADHRTLDECILAFFEIWVDNTLFSPALDQAVRDWAQLDDTVLDLVRKEDKKRLADISDVFKHHRFENIEADVRARVLYFSQVGYTGLNLGEALSERLALLAPYFHAYTGRKLDPKVEADFIKRMQK